MTRRIQLPDPIDRKGGVNPWFMRRIVAEVTVNLNDMTTRLSRVEAQQRIETDIAKPPSRIGAIAVVGVNVYVAVGTTPADWVIVS